MDGGCEYLGAVRIKDGLFLGDALSAWDVDFLVSNGVEYIVNCTASEFDYKSDQVKVLQLHWQEDEDVSVTKTAAGVGGVAERLADEIAKLMAFLEHAEAEGVSCLMHSRRGRSRAVLAICLYLMIKYLWTAQKALEFVLSRRPDLQLRKQFIIQLLHLEKILRTSYTLSSDWEVPARNGGPLSPDEILLRNTFRNSLQASKAEDLILPPPTHPRLRKQVTWQTPPRQDDTTDDDQAAAPDDDDDDDEDDDDYGVEDDDLALEDDDLQYIMSPYSPTSPEEDFSLEQPTPSEHLPNTPPKHRNDATAHWSIPTRRPSPEPLTAHKKSSEDLTIQIPLTVHPALLATIRPLQRPPPPPPLTASPFYIQRTNDSRHHQSIWPSITQIQGRPNTPGFPTRISPLAPSVMSFGPCLNRPFILPKSKSPLIAHSSSLPSAIKSFSMSRISVPSDEKPPYVQSHRAPARTSAVVRRFTDAGIWNPHYAPPAVVR